MAGASRSPRPEPRAPSAPALSADEFSAAVTAITSSFGDPTRRRVFLFARSRPDGVTASEVATEVGLHANVARHHLDKLAAAGHLEVAAGRVAGSLGNGAGRPSKRYLAAAGDLPLEVRVRQDDLVLTLLARALEDLPRERAESMAEEVGVSYGRAMASSVGLADGQRSVRSALHTVAAALTAHGFAAHAERRGDALAIVSEHCPFGGADVVSPVVCAVDRGIVRGMLEGLVGDTETSTAASRAQGDDSCVTSVGP